MTSYKTIESFIGCILLIDSDRLQIERTCPSITFNILVFADDGIFESITRSLIPFIRDKAILAFVSFSSFSKIGLALSLAMRK